MTSPNRDDEASRSTWAEHSRPRLTPAERSAIARAAVATRWKGLTADERRQATAPARRAMAEKFEAAPNPDGARREHMARMTAASIRQRRRSA